MTDKDKFKWCLPNGEMKPITVHRTTSLSSPDVPEHFPTVFRPRCVKKYRKIEGKKFRLPRKVKKQYKMRYAKKGFDIKKLKFSYRRLNRT